MGFGLFWLTATLVIGYYVQRNVRLALALKDEVKKMDSEKTSPSYEKLAMEEKHDISSLEEVCSASYECKTKADFLKRIKPHEAAIIELSAKLISENYNNDWLNGIENVNLDTSKNVYNPVATRPNYLKVRRFSNVVATASLYYGYKKKNKMAAMLLMTNISLIRQFVSNCNKNGGVSVSDAIITIALTGNINSIPKKTKGFNGYSSSLFPLLKNRLEKLDELYPLIGKAVNLERSFLPGFFDRFNKRATKELGEGTVLIEKKWMNDKLDLYYPPLQAFNAPYLKSKNLFNEYEKRIKKSFDALRPLNMLWTGIFSPPKAIFNILVGMSVPNFSQA